jgi:ABC-2 type transport system permease protein
MKKFIKWLKSPASDFALLVVLLILANLVGHRAFLRFDLTQPKSYSLSPASKQLMKTLDEPLSVKIFFSNNLPSPYSSTAQYVRDMLVEYKGAANRNFSYSFMDMDNKENQTLASNYGLNQVQIQEVKNSEVGFKQAYMGIVISYADAIETLDGITSSDGFEYKLTTKISKMISTTDALAGLGASDRIKMTLYVTDKLNEFQISGFDNIEKTVQKAYDSINRKNQDRIDYEKVDPAPSDMQLLADKYGLQLINWKNKDGSQGAGVIGLVIEHGDTFRLIPLSMQRSLFGYAIDGLDTIDKSISDSLQSLLSKTTQIGYITGHNEENLYNQNGQSRFASLISDMYEFSEIDLKKDAIPANITTIVINGPKSEFSDEELYKVDQFIMRGGNVMFYVDPFNEENQGYYQSPTYAPNETKLEKLLNTYGVQLGRNYVLDESCYKQRSQSYGNVSLYWAPMLQNSQLAQKSVITKNLGYVIFLQAGSVDATAALNDKDVKVTVLAKSSPKSWLLEKNIMLNPLMTTPPSDKSKEKPEDLVVLLEGKFKSAFASDPAPDTNKEGNLTAQSHLSQSTQSGRIFVAGTSQITGSQLIDENGSEPVAMFTRNIVDYMNGNAELCTMRTKGLSLNTLKNADSLLAYLAKYFNEFGLTVLIALAGLVIWRMREKRRKRIHDSYNPDDTRTITKKSKEGK